MSVHTKSALVTGSTGFVGRPTIVALRARGFSRVLEVSRSRTSVQSLDYRPIDLARCEFDLRRDLEGFDAVVHLASRVHVTNERAADPDGEFRRVNVDATARLARQAAAVGVKRFVFISSIKANGEATRGRAFTGRDEVAPADAYGRSKAEAEAALRSIGKESEMSIAILRPPLVFGAGARANFGALLRLVARAPALPFGALTNKRSLVEVEDLARAIALAAEPSMNVKAPAYVVCDPRAISTRDLALAIAEGLGRSPPLFSVPPALMRGFAALCGRAPAAERLTGDLEGDPSEFMEDFGWRPQRPLAEALADAAREWARSR